MSGAALGLPTEVRLVAVPNPEQRSKMDLNALREQLQKLVPGAHVTLTHEPQVITSIYTHISLFFFLPLCFEVVTGSLFFAHNPIDLGFFKA